MASSTGYGPRHGIWILPILMGGIVFIGMAAIRSLGESTDSTALGFDATSPTGLVDTSLPGLESTTTTSAEEQALLIAGEEVIVEAQAALDAGRGADPENAEVTIAELTTIQTELSARIGDLNLVAVTGELGTVKAELLISAAAVTQQIDTLGTALAAQDGDGADTATFAIADAIDAMDSALSRLANV